MKDSAFLNIPRGQQVYEDVLRRRPRAWLALDDDADGWPEEHAARYIQTHMHEGLSDPDVLFKLKIKLQEMCR